MPLALCKCAPAAGLPRWVLFAAVALCGAALRGFELGVTLPFAESYLDRLHAPAALRGLLVPLLVGGGVLAEVTVSFAAGVWADTVVETRPIVLLSAVPQALGGILYFFAETSSQLVLSRVISGLGAGAATAVATELVRAAPARLRTAGLAALAAARLLGVAFGPWAGARLQAFPDIFKHKVTPENAAGLVLLLAYLGYMLLVALFYPNLTAEQIADLQTRGQDEVDSDAAETRTEDASTGCHPAGPEPGSSSEPPPCKTPPNSETETSARTETTAERKARLYIPLPDAATQRPDIQASAGWFTPVESAVGSGWFTPDEQRKGVDSGRSPTVSKLVAQYENSPKTAESLPRPAPGKDSAAAPGRRKQRDISIEEGAGDGEPQQMTESLVSDAPVASSLSDDIPLPFSPNATSTRPPSAASNAAEVNDASRAETQGTSPAAGDDTSPGGKCGGGGACGSECAAGGDAADRPLEGPYSAPLALPLAELQQSLREAVPAEVLGSPRHHRLRALLLRWRRVLSGPTLLLLAAGAVAQLGHTSLQMTAQRVASPPLYPQFSWLLTADAVAQLPVLLLLLLAPLLQGTGGGPLLTICALVLSAVGHFGLASSVSELAQVGPAPPGPPPTSSGAAAAAGAGWCAVARGSAVLQCCGYALLEPAGVTLLVSVTPVTLYGRALAYWRLAAGGGLLLGLVWAGSVGARAVALLLGPLVMLAMAASALVLAHSRGFFSVLREQVALVNLLGPHLPVQPTTRRMRTVSVINHLHALYRGIRAGAGGAAVTHATSQTDGDAGAADAEPSGGVRFMIGGAAVAVRARRDTVLDVGDIPQQPLLTAERQPTGEAS